MICIPQSETNVFCQGYFRTEAKLETIPCEISSGNYCSGPHDEHEIFLNNDELKSLAFISTRTVSDMGLVLFIPI